MNLNSISEILKMHRAEQTTTDKARHDILEIIKRELVKNEMGWLKLSIIISIMSFLLGFMIAVFIYR